MKKKISIAVILFMLLFNNVALGEAEGTKDESVYGILEGDGSISSLYVVNAIEGSTADYGKYASLENLVSLEDLSQDDDIVILPAYEDTFYYKGTMDEYEFPWNYSISYNLDGEDISAKDLAGKEGDLIIYISVNQGADSKSHFFENYATQISLALSNELCSGIEAEGATVVEVGGTKQIAFTVLPGNTANFKISAKVNNFEMGAINVNAVNMVFNIDVDTSSFTDQLGELSDAISDLDSGAGELLKGIDSLSAGMQSYSEGLKEYQAGMAAYAEGGGQLIEGLEGISGGLDALASQNEALMTGIGAMEQSAFDQANSQLAGTGLPELNRDNFQPILEGQAAFEPLLIQLQQTLQMVDGLYGYLGGVSELSEGASGLSVGLKSYVDNGNILAQSANDLYNGAVSLNDGLKAYRSGVAEYKSGTARFKSSTANMDSDMETLIVDMLADFSGDGDVISFVSEKNTNIVSVQFFCRTEPIEVEEIKDTTEVEEEAEGFWQRILQLFGF